MKNAQTKEFEKLSFEDALQKLEGIVDKMEDGNLPLDQMIKFFEEGSALSNMCAKKLKDLEKKIEILVKATSDGGEWRDFNENSKNQSSTDEWPEEDGEASFSSKDKDVLF